MKGIITVLFFLPIEPKLCIDKGPYSEKQPLEGVKPTTQAASREMLSIKTGC